MKYYFIAFGIWILKILMCATIILIPVERYLSSNYAYWCLPFIEAEERYIQSL